MKNSIYKVIIKTLSIAMALSMLCCSLPVYAATGGKARAAADSSDEVDDDDNNKDNIVSSADKEYIIQNHVNHTSLSFEDFEIKTFDEKDFDKMCEGLSGYVNDPKQADKVSQLLDEIEDYVGDIEASYTIADIYSSLDADDEAMSDKVKELDELYTNIYDKCMINYQIIANSKNADILKEQVTSDFWQEILEYEPMTDEQKEIGKRVTELVLQYESINKDESTAIIDKKEYTMEELSTALDNGDITFLDYLYGCYDITTERNESMGNIYLELVELRNQLAKSYGYDNYAEYAYAEVYNRNYTPHDMDYYRDMVKDVYLDCENDASDYFVDNYYEEYLEMKDEGITEEDCHEALLAHLGDVDEALYEAYDYMMSHNLCDISPSATKVDSGFTAPILGQYNAPYLFNKPDGTVWDITTLIHEFGHYSAFYFSDEDFYENGGDSLDLAEIHSQGLEMIYTNYYDEMFGDNADLVRAFNLRSSTYSVVTGVKEDEFQLRVYEYEGELTLDKLNEIYYEVSEEYGDLEDYNSYYLSAYGYLPEGQITEWVEIPHTFQSPMYYISYSISQAAVEELRCIMLEDREQGIETYRRLLSMGVNDDFDGTLEELGINNPVYNPRFDVYAENIYMLLDDLENGSMDSLYDDEYDYDEYEDEYDYDEYDEYEDEIDEFVDELFTPNVKKDQRPVVSWLPEKWTGYLIVAFLFVVAFILTILIFVVALKKDKPEKNMENNEDKENKGDIEGNNQNHQQPEIDKRNYF